LKPQTLERGADQIYQNSQSLIIYWIAGFIAAGRRKREEGRRKSEEGKGKMEEGKCCHSNSFSNSKCSRLDG
jgi:hypothetical protein